MAVSHPTKRDFDALRLEIVGVIRMRPVAGKKGNPP